MCTVVLRKFSSTKSASLNLLCVTQIILLFQFVQLVWFLWFVLKLWVYPVAFAGFVVPGCPVSLACPVSSDSAVCRVSPLSGWSSFGVVQFVLSVRVVLYFGWICWSGWPGWCCCCGSASSASPVSRASPAGLQCNSSRLGMVWVGFGASACHLRSL